LNFPGYHFHFLDSQKQRGGHVLDCDIKSGIAEIDETGRFLTVLPASKEFYRLDFSAN
jgi:acetolactate decarboxylase